MHDQNGVVDHDADQNHESQHGQDVQGLIGNHEIDDEQAENAAGRGQRHTEDNNKRIEEAFKQGGHEQIRDEQGEEQIVLQRVIGVREIIRGARQTDIIQPTKLSPFFDGQDDVLFDQLHGRFQRHLVRRNDLNGDRPFSFNVIDLFGAGNESNVGHVSHRGKAATASKDGQIRQVLRSIGILIHAANGEVDFVPFKLVVTGLCPVNQRIHRKAEFLIRHLHVGRPFSFQAYPDFRTAQVEAWYRSNLCSRQKSSNASENPSAQRHKPIEVRSRNFNVDVSSFAQPPLKQTALRHNPDDPGDIGKGFAKNRNQLSDPAVVVRAAAHEHGTSACHVEEIPDTGAIQRRFLRGPGFDVPIGGEHVLNRFSQTNEFFRIIPGRGENNSDDQISISTGKIFGFWHQEHGDADGERGESDDDCHATTDVAAHPMNQISHAVGVQSHPVGHSTATIRRRVHASGSAVLRGPTVSGREHAGGQARNHGDGDQQTQTDAGADGNGDVSKELPCLFFNEDDRHEDGNGGQRAGQHRAPHFDGAVVGRLKERFSRFSMPVNVFEDHDRIID